MENEKVSASELQSRTRADALHVRALERTRMFFKSLDLRALEEMRVGLELAPEQIGVVIDVYQRALDEERRNDDVMRRASTPMMKTSRRAVPMSSPNIAFKNTRFTITQTLKTKFRAERLFIAPPLGETAAMWLIHDVLVDDKTQFAQNGDLPGDMFLSTAIDSFVSYDTGSKFEIVATYIGERLDARFSGGFLGMQDDASKESAAEV